MDLNTVSALMVLLMLVASVKRAIWGPPRNFARVTVVATLLGIAGVLAAFPDKEGFLFNGGAIAFLLGIGTAVVSAALEAMHRFKQLSKSEGR